ncbi:hypothetical protein LOD99_16224 [Oopsacas minuta]|uniref:Uncharacterized protein n=1 Tax=Oopsacas minuta TaxID=111878 RepID=A0AAV7K779_9METZ|nr:hypothetical protein LOD99_16224 [Oopsacas minuta]
MNFRGLILVIFVTISSAYGIDGQLPIINDVIKTSDGYSFSATLKFTYSSILAALYNKIDIQTCNIDQLTNEPSYYQLVRTIEPTLTTKYEQYIEGLSPGKVCIQVCGRSNYRNVKKCSKIYTFENDIKRKLVPSANRHKNVLHKNQEIIPSTLMMPTSISAYIIGYDLVIHWKYLHHSKSPFSLSIRLLDEIDRQILFHNGARELILQTGTNTTSIRLPYSHFKYKHIQISLCSLQPSLKSEVAYEEKNCPIPLVVHNDVMLYNKDAGVKSVRVDRGIASVKLNKPVSKYADIVYVECIWFDNRIDRLSPEQVLKQEIKTRNEQLWSLSVTSLELHSAYSCFIHMVIGNVYSLFADKPFVFVTPDL